MISRPAISGRVGSEVAATVPGRRHAWLLGNNPYLPIERVLVIVGDALLVGLLGIVVGWLNVHPLSPPMVGLFAATTAVALYIFGAYDLRPAADWAAYFVRVIAAVAVAAAATIAVAYALLSPLLRQRLLLQVVLTPLVLAAWRSVSAVAVPRARAKPQVAMIGAGSAARALLSEYRARAPRFDVVSLYDDDPGKAGMDVHGFSVSGNSEALFERVLRGDIDVVVVAITHERNSDLLDVLIQCRYLGVQVLDTATVFELMSERLPVEHLSHDWVALLSRFETPHARMYARIKRVADVVCSGLGLFLTGPFILAAMFAMWLTSPGPVLYRQTRVGQHGRWFSLYKIRTMVLDAERTGEAVWASENDPRVTTVGRFLRLSRLDELPQFWNVLRGDMSLIGPRPERPQFVSNLEVDVPFYGLRHMAKPGITGWAQVSYPYGSSTHAALRKLEYDLFYIRHMSPLFDGRIALKTIRTMLFQFGSR
jgi:exopolysaccharide biosynthesis polyprenyl glycosylphosphotransferase